MKALADALPRDNAGRLVYGNPRKGCRFCGHVAQKVAANGKAVVYHPGVECCAEAIEIQIGYREDEIKLRHARIAELQAELERQAETVRAYGESRAAAASEAKLRYERSQRGIGHQIAAIEREINGSREHAIIGLAQESADLRRKLGRMRR